MRIKYDAPKGTRIKKGFTITPKGKRRNFSGVMCNTTDQLFWWSDSLNKWFTDLDNDIYAGGFSSHKGHIYNLKGFIRFVKKHRHYLPKGTTLTLCSNFDGYDIHCIL